LREQLDLLQTAYDTDKELWEQKFNFMEKQKLTLKEELNDQNKKFENTINIFKK